MLILPTLFHLITYDRICPGRWLADSSLFLVIANALHVFDVGALKSDGETYDPFGETETSGMKMYVYYYNNFYYD